MNEIEKTISIRRYAVYLTAVILLVCGAIFLLSSCEMDDEQIVVKSKQSPDGELVTVKFELDGMGYNEDVVGIRKAPLNPPEGGKYLSSYGEVGESTSHIQLISPPSGELEGAIYMVATLTEDEVPVMLRAAVPLDANSQVRIVAYSGTPEAKNDHADYQTISNSLDVSPVGSALTLPSGSYRFVAYSFHNSTPLAAFADTTAAFSSQDVLWGDTIETVGSTNNTVLIRTHHKFSQVKVFASIDQTIGALINSISGAVISNVDSRLVVQNGNLHPVGNSTVPVSWIGGGSGSNWPSNPMLVNTNGNPPSLTINSVVIDNVPYNGPYTVNYSTPLVAGRDYTLNVRFTKSPPTLVVNPLFLNFEDNQGGSGVAQTVTVSSNQTWTFNVSGTYASLFNVTRTGNTLSVYPYAVNMDDFAHNASITITTTTGSPILSETVSLTHKPAYYGGASDILFFFGSGPSRTLQVAKWNTPAINTSNYLTEVALFTFGGVVGTNLNNGVSGWHNTNSVLFNPTSTTSFTPNANSSLFVPDYYSNHGSGNAWNMVPRPKTSDNSYHNLANVKAGKGDPCRLVGMTVALINSFTTDAELYAAERGWRLFTPEENGRFIKGPDSIKWKNWTGAYYRYIPGVNIGPPTSGDYMVNYWVANGGDASNPSVAILPVIQGPFTNPLGEPLPALGNRGWNGNIFDVGFNGSYWTNTPSGSTAGTVVMIEPSQLTPAGSGRSYSFFPVRCIRK